MHKGGVLRIFVVLLLAHLAPLVVKVVDDDVAQVHVLRVLIPRAHQSVVQVVGALHLEER